MLKAVLFDLDGTLLPMDTDAFMKIYFGNMARHLAPYGYEPKTLIDSIWDGTACMVRNDGSVTNDVRFWNRFAEIYGEGSREHMSLIDDFYNNGFLAAETACKKNPAAAETVAELKKEGYRLALATNPIFPAVATRHRMRWAGVKEEDFEWVTWYENSCHAKPNPAYYQDCLERLGLPAEEVLMVGNDVGEDMIAAKLGMKVFLLTDCLLNPKNLDISAYPQGSFAELMEYIRGL